MLFKCDNCTGNKCLAQLRVGLSQLREQKFNHNFKIF